MGYDHILALRRHYWPILAVRVSPLEMLLLIVLECKKSKGGVLEISSHDYEPQIRALSKMLSEI